MDSLAPGTLLARRYRLLDRIGVGGMSVIWRAHDEMLERGVAVKVLAAELAADSRFRDLVRAEARAAAALVHPNVTATYDYGETVGADGETTAFVVMELLEGEALSNRLTAGPLPWPEALRVCAEVADALAAAHRHGIVHRDVTADNVMLSGGGAKVLDFGIATTVGAPDDDDDGMTFGTPAYVAPERLDGRRAWPANDTYALGVLLFEMLTGHPPYPAETWEDLAGAPRGDPPPLTVPGLPEPVVDLVRRCLAIDPQLRPTAHQVGWTLRRHLPGAGRRARNRLTGGRSWVRRAGAAVGTAAALALGVWFGATVLGPDSTPYLGSGGNPASPEPRDTTAPASRPWSPAQLSPEAEEADPGDNVDTARPVVNETPGVTLDTISLLVEEAHGQGDVRTDVAEDLQNLITNLQRDMAAGSVDLAHAVEQLRNKVETRAREGALGQATAAELDAALDQLAA
jgi:hypothetical protein